MKILFQNYANDLSTEAMYLSRALGMAGVETELWSDANISAYDILDSYKPDVVLTDFRYLTNDVVKYLSQGGSPELVLNVTGASEDDCKKIEELSDPIKIRMVFTNAVHKKEKFKKLKLEGIYPAADIFMQRRPIQPALPLGILNDGDPECVAKAVGEHKTYHLLSLQDGDYSDHRVNVSSLHEVYCLYERFVITGKSDLVNSQAFFDSCLACHKVDILPEKKSETQFYTGFLKSVFSEPKEDVEDLGEQLKKQIVAKHTPFNRAERLMRLLKNDQAVRSLQNLRNNVVK